MNQLSLFDIGTNLEHLYAVCEGLKAHPISENTRIIYRDSWKRYERWCKAFGRDPLPATVQQLVLWAASNIHEGLTVSTAVIRVCGVLHHCRECGSPLDDTREVWRMLSSARRLKGTRPQAKLALTVPHLAQISELLQRQSGTRAIRDRAIMVLGFASGLRRSEIAALQYSDLVFVPEGLCLQIRRSKTDQAGKGRAIGIKPGTRTVTCPVLATRDWVQIRGGEAGHFFCQVRGSAPRVGQQIDGELVAKIVKRNVALIGLDSRLYSGHSLRAGCVTAAVETGASELAIMQRTGHRSVSTVHRYVRPASVFSMNPLERAL